MFKSVVILAPLFFIFQCHGSKPLDSCNQGWIKEGCFRDSATPDHPLPYQLLNRRDRTSSNYDGFLIDWNNYNQTIYALACKCAELAKKKGYRYFGLQFYGECWSGPENPSFDRDGPSDQCLNGYYKECDNTDTNICIGKQFTNYIYKLTSLFKPGVNGGWGEWESWSPCSQSCNGGKRVRKRSCDSPQPSLGGYDCIGSATETGDCNTEKCYGVCNKQLEVAFLLDTSGSVKLPNWLKTVEFTNKLVGDFIVGANKIHVGVVTFSSSPRLLFRLSNSQYWSNAAAQKKISSARYTKGGTRIDLGLNYLRQNIFCSSCGVRKNVPRAVLVVTDGINNVRNVVAPAAKRLSNENVHIVALGVGPNVPIEMLRSMTKDDSDVFTIKGYEFVYERLNGLAKTICETT